LAEARALDRDYRFIRDFIVEALRMASLPPGPVDWERVKEAEEAYARGETKEFTRR
jgi:hypothetical protein